MNPKFMWLAINEAKKCVDDVPVGAVAVKNGKIIAVAHNTREKNNAALGHAEINLIKKLTNILASKKLTDIEIYVTLEPCVMCTGAIIQSGISKLYFGSYDRQYGCVASKYSLTMDSEFNHNVPFIGGILEKECNTLLVDFFNALRNKNSKYCY